MDNTMVNLMVKLVVNLSVAMLQLIKLAVISQLAIAGACIVTGNLATTQQDVA
jgi:hypothetical protein